MWSFLNNRGPVTMSPNPNSYPGSTKVAGFHVGSLDRGILDLASSPSHKQFSDFINRSNSASELVSDACPRRWPEVTIPNIIRSKSAIELSTWTSDNSMGGKSGVVSPARAIPSTTTTPVDTENSISPSPKKRRCYLQKKPQEQQEQQQQQQSKSHAMVVSAKSEDDEENEEEYSSGDEDMVPVQVRQRSDSITSEDSFIVFMDSDDCVDGSVEDDDTELESDSDSSSDDDEDDDDDDDDDDICFEGPSRCTSCTPTTTKRVHWAPVDELCTFGQTSSWEDALWEARISPWMIMASDRMRFKHRILSTELHLKDVLGNEHRARIYEERFENQD